MVLARGNLLPLRVQKVSGRFGSERTGSTPRPCYCLRYRTYICSSNFHRGSAPLAAATLPVIPTTRGSFSPRPLGCEPYQQKNLRAARLGRPAALKLPEYPDLSGELPFGESSTYNLGLIRLWRTRSTYICGDPLPTNTGLEPFLTLH